MPRLQLLHQGQKSPRYGVPIVGRQKGTESKARLPDNVTLGKDLQLSMLPLPPLEDEDNKYLPQKRCDLKLQEIHCKLGQAHSKCGDTLRGLPPHWLPTADPAHETRKDPSLPRPRAPGCELLCLRLRPSA